MFGAGVVMFLLAGAVGFFFGIATSLGIALSRMAPAAVSSAQAYVARIGGADLWHGVIAPVLEAPCWAPFAALGALFVLIGILRRL